MADFALIVFSEVKAKTVSAGDRIKDFFQRLSGFLKKRDPEQFIKKVELFENLNVYLIKLPYSVADLEGMKPERIKKAISDAAAGIGMDNCIIPSRITRTHNSFKLAGNCYNGTFLYKSLLLNILEEILSGSRHELGDLEIVLTQGEGNEELFTFIRLLSPRVKYITVMVNDRSAIEEEINRIFSDSGLSVGLTTNYRNGLKGADVVINLGGIRQFETNITVNTRALVVNYYESENLKAFAENLVINGIEVELPYSIRQKFDNQVFEYFDMMEISEAILLNKLGLEGNIMNCADVETMQRISREFRLDGFKITGFKGRHDIFGLEQVKEFIYKKL